jgi:hypothetical protein
MRIVRLILSLTLVAASAAAQQPANPYQPLKHVDRVRLMEAKVAGDKAVTIRVATRMGGVPELAAAIQQFGGAIRERDDKLGYIRARIPIDATMRIAARFDVVAITVNETNWNLSAPSSEFTSSVRRQLALSFGDSITRPGAPDRNTPAINPYFPVKDLGSPQFIAAHPTYDGRGATIGIVEEIGDPTTVELQTALTLDGKPVRKLAYIDVNPPDLPGVVRGIGADSTKPDPAEGFDRARAYMKDSVVAASQTFTYKGETFRAPRDGAFRIGRIENVGPWLNYRSGPWMLWSVSTGEVWIDTHNNRDFTMSNPIRDYNASGDFTWIGENDPATSWDDRPTVLVLIHPDIQVVDAFIGGYVHTIGVAAVAAGTNIYGSKAHGVAPNARLVENYFSFEGAPTMDFVRLARNKDVDVITNQLSITARLRDGHTVFSTILERLWAEQHKLIFISATNEPPYVNNVELLPSATGAHAMSGWVSRDVWWAQYGIRIEKSGTMPRSAGAAGPASDGGFAPFALAPVAYLAPWSPAWAITNPSVSDEKPTVHDMYPMPQTYVQGAGTSFAAPGAAGVAALLVSAAKQEKIPHDGLRLEIAMAEGAVMLPDIPAYRQGNGLLNVARSWAVLQRLAKQPDPVEIRGTAPVRTVLSHELPTPHIGRGLFEREGWSVGDTGTRTITLTRITGSNDLQKFTIRYRQNDGTFRGPAGVELPLNVPVSLSMYVAPRTPGAHSAIMEVVDAYGSAVYRMMLTVIAASPLSEVAGTTSPALSRADTLNAYFTEIDTRFIRIPPGIDSVTITLSFGSPKSAKFTLNGPSGKRFQNGTLVHGDSGAQYRTANTRTVTLVYPEPGVWELGVENANDSLQFEKAQPVLTAVMGVTAYRTTQPIVGRAIRLKFVPGDTAVAIPINVNFTTKTLRAAMKNASGDADLDFYILKCDAGKCTVSAISTIPGAEKMIAVDNVWTQRGSWKLMVDPIRIPPGGITVECIVNAR